MRSVPCLGLLSILSLVRPAAAQPEERVGVTVLVHGERADEVRAALSDLPEGSPVEVTLGSLPVAPPPEAGSAGHEAALSEARSAYVDADFDRCLSSLGDDALVHAALARGDRLAASRILFWRVACRVGAGDPAAREDARRFAVLGLDVPAAADGVSPEVERTLSAALAEIASAPRAPLEIASTPAAAVSIDGRRPRCQTPCTADLVEGDHVVAVSTPGFEPSWNLVRVPSADPADFTLTRASPELAARQWARRWLGRDGLDSIPSVELLASAVRARRLVLFVVGGGAGGGALRGTLAIDGSVAARAERLASEELGAASRQLLLDLLVEGGAVAPAPEVYESPWFWIGIVGGIALASGVTAALLFDPGTRSSVRF